MAKTAKSDEVSIDTSQASQPEVPKAEPLEAAPAVQASQEAEAPAAVAVDAPAISIIAVLEHHATVAHHAGDFATEAVLREVAVAAGTLRQKTLGALHCLDGHLRDLIREIHCAL